MKDKARAAVAMRRAEGAAKSPAGGSQADKKRFHFKIMVGDPGIEPGMGRPGGVTVPCRTLQLVARRGFVYPRGRGASRVLRKDFGLHRCARLRKGPGLI